MNDIVSTSVRIEVRGLTNLCVCVRVLTGNVIGLQLGRCGGASVRAAATARPENERIIAALQHELPSCR